MSSASPSSPSPSSPNELPPGLEAMSDAAAAAVDILFCDIDDTLTLDGRLPAVAYAAVERLADAGISVVPVTGRPAGWCDMIARFWPVDAVIGENGAFYFAYDRQARRMRRVHWRSADQLAQDRVQLETIRREVLAEVPGCAIATDQAYREADLAVDFAEDVGPLDAAAIAGILAVFERHGAVAKVSSIHVNGWFGDHDKRRMCARYLEAERHMTLVEAQGRAAFVGDSPNDAPMFGSFPCSVGVRNLERFIAELEHLPAFLTAQPGGLGFVELADKLLVARTRPACAPCPTS